MPGSARLAATLVLAVSLAGAGVFATPAPAAAATTAGIEVEITRLVGALRAQHGLPPLRTDVRLVAASRTWSAHMAGSGTLAHDPKAGAAMPAGTRAWAENVGWTSTTGDVGKSLHDMFVDSAPHRANLLDGRFTDLGIGIATGGGRTYVTQRLTAGAPARVAAAVEPTAKLAEQHFGGGKATHAVLARDDIYADALASGPLAGRAGPVLLTPVGPVLHPVVRLALHRSLQPGATVWIVGGRSAVSAGVEAEVRAAGWEPRRLAGENRFETAARVASAVRQRDGQPDEVLIATGAGWADAAAGGAYGAQSGAPVLLALKDSVPPATSRALAELQPRKVSALGGSAVLSDRTLAQLGADRVAGSTRQGTAARIAGQLWGHSDGGPARWTAVPGSGDDAWTWALGAAPAAARLGTPVLLLGPELSPELHDYLEDLGYGGGDTAELLTHGPVPATTAAKVRTLLR